MKAWFKARGQELWNRFWYGETRKKELERQVYNVPLWIGDVVVFHELGRSREGLLVGFDLSQRHAPRAEVISYGERYTFLLEDNLLTLLEKGGRSPTKGDQHLLEKLEDALPDWRQR